MNKKKMKSKMKKMKKMKKQRKKERKKEKYLSLSTTFISNALFTLLLHSAVGLLTVSLMLELLLDFNALGLLVLLSEIGGHVFFLQLLLATAALLGGRRVISLFGGNGAAKLFLEIDIKKN